MQIGNLIGAKSRIFRTDNRSAIGLTEVECPLLAQSGHSAGRGGMTAFDPKRTFPVAVDSVKSSPRDLARYHLRR